MKGLELSKLYFEKCAYPLIKEKVPRLIPHMAFGLVGEGSECFKLDDKLSQDHDFGPGFCIWMPQRLIESSREIIDDILYQIPSEFMGYKRQISHLSDKRIGLFSIEEFYYKYTNCRKFPMNDMEWLNIPESYLATASNGEVFIDNLGEFTRIRNYLLSFYPEDVKKKKLVAYMAMMAQSGQYNLERCHDRNDFDGYYFSKAKFIENAYGALFLLANSYKPYYKLAARKLKSLDYYPEEIFEDINLLQKINNINQDKSIVERICKYIKDIVFLRYGIYSSDSFLIDIAIALQKSIINEDIRGLHIMKGNKDA